MIIPAVEYGSEWNIGSTCAAASEMIQMAYIVDECFMVYANIPINKIIYEISVVIIIWGE